MLKPQDEQERRRILGFLSILIYMGWWLNGIATIYSPRVLEWERDLAIFSFKETNNHVP